MIDEKFCIDTEEIIQQLIPFQCTTGHIPHGIHAMSLQFPGISPAQPPEIRERPVVPQRPAVRNLIQYGDPASVLIRRLMLRHNIHGDLRQVQIRADSRRGCDTGLPEHLRHHMTGQFFRRHTQRPQIIRHIHEYLVNGIHMNIRCRHIT